MNDKLKGDGASTSTPVDGNAAKAVDNSDNFATATVTPDDDPESNVVGRITPVQVPADQAIPGHAPVVEETLGDMSFGASFRDAQQTTDGLGLIREFAAVRHGSEQTGPSAGGLRYQATSASDLRGFGDDHLRGPGYDAHPSEEAAIAYIDHFATAMAQIRTLAAARTAWAMDLRERGLPIDEVQHAMRSRDRGIAQQVVPGGAELTALSRVAHNRMMDNLEGRGDDQLTQMAAQYLANRTRDLATANDEPPEPLTDFRDRHNDPCLHYGKTIFLN